MNHKKDIPLLSTQLLLDRGYSKKFIAKEVKQKRLLPLRKGLYVETQHWERLYPSERHLLQMKALSQRCDYVFTHESAALALGLPVLRVPRELHIMALPHSRGQVKGAKKHYYSQQPATQEILGITLTTAVHTVVDCAKSLPLADALCIADGALHLKQLTHAQAFAALNEVTGRGARSCRRVAELMSALAESPGETLTRIALIQAGIDFVEQQWIQTASGSFRADFLIQGFKLLLEFDGDVKYRDNAERSVLAERKRERALQNEGWTVIRVEWRDVQDPGRVAFMVRQGMYRASRY